MRLSPHFRQWERIVVIQQADRPVCYCEESIQDGSIASGRAMTWLFHPPGVGLDS